MRQTNELPLTFDAELVAGRRRFLDYVLRRVNDRELAEDILQDALLRAVKAAPELRDESRLVRGLPHPAPRDRGRLSASRG